MKNPLNKRLPREMKEEFGKYLVIFVLLVALIGFVSGFLIADNSMKVTYDQSFDTYHIEDGYFDTTSEITHLQKRKIEKQNVNIYENYFVEKNLSNQSTLRIFQDRTTVNKTCLLEGTLPVHKGEIGLDRMYATNNKIKIGDTIRCNKQKWKVTGYVALSDYSSLFSNNNDTMFDAMKFGVAVVAKSEFQTFSSSELTYRYSWTYHQKPTSEGKEHKVSEKLMKSMSKVITLDNYVPQYQNQAITFTGNDMGSDKAMMTVLLYMVIVILAFVFAITISNTIRKEASTIGTLLASGYTKNELIKHYLKLPLIVTLIGAAIGNILGYTILEDVVKNMYYSSYSLTKYESMFSLEAFLETTVVPFLVMLVVNYVVLRYRLSISPLKLIRRDLSHKKQGKVMKLGTKLPFMTRFRLRIILQNKSNYFMLFLGITFANLLLLFGMGLPIVLNHYQKNIKKSMFCPYQYILSVPTSLTSSNNAFDQMISMFEYSLGTRTDNTSAEKFSSYALDTTDSICDREEILVYGIKDHSKYVKIPEFHNGVYVSSAYADKYQLKKGDIITLKEKYKEKTYRFKVTGIYNYIGALTIFMPQDKMNQTFDLDDDYFSGYFSNTQITDINKTYLGTKIDLSSLTKVSRQLDLSMGSMMYLVDGFAILIFIVLIYLLSKLVIEKNATSISMAKILGYQNTEIARLYLFSTSVIVILSFLISMIIDYYLMLWIFRQMMLTSMSGWIQFEVDKSLFLEMFFTGLITYAIVAVFEWKKIQSIPMTEALHNIDV